MDVNFLMKTDSTEGQSSSAKLFITACVLIILSLGGGVFLYLNARSKLAAIKPKTKPGGYEKIAKSGGEPESQVTTSSYGEYSDRIIEGEEDEEENEEEGIVYMGKDGTVYRKFKYGLLDDDEMELEYDDETYSYR